jgi:lipoprotein-releasing system permease protein
MQGLEIDLKNKIIGNTAHISVYKIGSAQIDNYNELASKINKVEGVRGATGAIYKEAMLLNRLGLSSGIIVKGIDPISYNEVNNFSSNINKSIDKKRSLKILMQDEIPPIILGEELARDMLLSLGDYVTILSPLGEITPFGNQPKLKKFKYVGSFKSGYWEFDSKFAYINLKDAQKFWSMGDTVHIIEIGVENLNQTQKLSKIISSVLPAIYYTKDWRQSHKSLFSALQLEKTVMFLILTMIIVVACFNIIATLVMIVMEKIKDISILKAMGAKTKNIVKIFTLVGMAIGGLGTMLGMLLGLLLCFLLGNYIKFPLNPEVYFTDTLPVRVDLFNVAIVCISSLIICYLATIYPSYKAGKLDPIIGLRNE